MSVKIYHNLLSEDERLKLIDYFENNKNLARDVRPDVTNGHKVKSMITIFCKS